MNHKILIVSCYFPPGGGIQVQRALSLAKYLPRNGFDVHVLTARNASVPTHDPELLQQVPPSVHIHRTWTLEVPFHLRKKIWSRVNPSDGNGAGNMGHAAIPESWKSWLSETAVRVLCPDPQVGWYPFALQKGSQVIERERIQTLLVTAPPFSAFLIANELKRRYPQLKLISDFRDEWLLYFVNTFAFKGSAHIRRRAAEIERETVQLSDRVIAVTSAALDQMRFRYPEHAAEKFAMIPNGYDPDLFPPCAPQQTRTDRMVIAYVGTVYKTSSPQAYLDALYRLPEALRSRVETHFVGRIAEDFDRSSLQNQISHFRVREFLPHKQALAWMQQADYLLLPWCGALTVPGRLFEYLATGKPILALVNPNSDTERIVRETGSGWCADPADTEAVQRLLRTTIQSRPTPSINWPAIRCYERSRLAAAYGDLIRDV